MASQSKTVLTPDQRYIVVIGRAGPRLWRATNPSLPPKERQELVRRLMNARRQIGAARSDPAMVSRVRRDVQKAKEALGERGPVWWDDGAPDYNRRLVKNTPYADWWAARLG